MPLLAYSDSQVSGISITSGTSPAETMVANFWKASLHGREMISTLVPGLAASNFETMPFSVSVRSGLVMTSTSLLKKRLEKESPDKAMNIELVSEVKDAATRISKIVNGIRMITRNAEADSLAKVSLSKLISDTIDLCQEKFNQQGIDLKFINHLSLTEPDILECRSVEITQVLINLINNAYDAIENLSERWLRIELSSEGNNFYLSLTDSGKGIPEEVQDKMMNPFFTTKEIGKGTGLGLTISKGVIEKYHGHLRMEKTSPNTKFVISLPRQQS